MAERKFDYKTVQQAYGNMQKITTTISDTLNKANIAVRENVQVIDKAIYGDLGGKLLLDWENSSSSFPTFVEKFGTWATLIAQSSGNYNEFEEEVKGFNTNNPLGSASKGMKSSPIISSYYTDYYNDNYQDYVDKGGTGTVDTSVIPTISAANDKDGGTTTGSDASTVGRKKVEVEIDGVKYDLYYGSDGFVSFGDVKPPFNLELSENNSSN